VGGNTAGVARRQTFDLTASGFTTGEIDAGTLTLNFTGWFGGEDGVNDGGRIRVNYLDDSMTLIDTTATSTTIAAAGVYMQHTIGENIPSGTRFLQLDMVLRGNAGGATLPFGDDFEARIDYPA
jgi:hypothetical protein